MEMDFFFGFFFIFVKLFFVFCEKNNFLRFFFCIFVKLFFVYFLGICFGKIFFWVGVFSDRRVDLDIAGCVRSFPHVFRKKKWILQNIFRF